MISPLRCTFLECYMGFHPHDFVLGQCEELYDGPIPAPPEIFDFIETEDYQRFIAEFYSYEDGRNN